MQHSEFWMVVEKVFGSVRGRSLATDLILLPWNISAQDALEAGYPPQIVWDSIRKACDLGEEYEFPHRQRKVKRAP